MRLIPLLLALALLSAACSRSAAAPGDGSGFVQTDERGAVIPVEQREPAPDVVAETLDGDQLALRDLDGPVVVNFWASWCGPCAQEAPALQRLAEAYDGRVAFVGVNVKDGRAAASSFERDFGVAYPSWSDPAASIAASFGGIGPAALPSTLVLDAEHRVAARLFGAVDEALLAPHLDNLLAEA